MKSVKEILKNNSLVANTNDTNLKTILDTSTNPPLTVQDSVMSNYPSSKANQVCPQCQGRGIYLEGDVAYPCRCMQTRKLENQFRNARISRELMNCRFERFRLEYYRSEMGDTSHQERAAKALQAAKNFVSECQQDPHNLGVLFTGPVGSGKTFLAAAIANQLMEAELKVLFLVVPDLLDELRATYKSNVNEMDLLDTARTIPILILDDLGVHNYTDWTRNRLYSIINYRMNEQLPTVITSNLTLDEMEEYIGIRTTSRIIQSTRIFRITIAKDIRHQIYYEREGRK
jgi:DNA replication protein